MESVRLLSYGCMQEVAEHKESVSAHTPLATIDRLHKWRPKKYSFLFMLIRLASLVGTDTIQNKMFLQNKASWSH